MNSSVIVFPGSNCDRDVATALTNLQFKNKMVWHKDSELPKSDLIVIPGGFSYGDYLRSGAIAAKSKLNCGAKVPGKALRKTKFGNSAILSPLSIRAYFME